VRYTANELHDEFGGAFKKVASSEQQFVYCYCLLTL
jgi:hypothetical protein